MVPTIALGALARGADLDRLAASEVARLNASYGLSAKVQVIDAGDTDASPTGLVTVSRTQVAEILSRISALHAEEVERFIIGHEMVHEMQFRKSGRDVLTRSVDERKVAECQADMLAALDLGSAGKLDEARTGALEDVLNAAFEVGSENYALADHPDREQRRLAVRFGFSLGVLRVLQASPAGERKPDLETAILRYLDLRTGEEPYAWSRRLAEQIVHVEHEAVSALSLDSPDVRFNTSADHPVVAFTLPYTNTSSKPLHVEMEIVIAAVPRYESSDTKSWLRVDSKHFSFDLAPGAMQPVSGELTWYADSDRMPSLLYPPGKQTLYSARFIDSPSASLPQSASTLKLAETAPAEADAAAELGWRLHRYVHDSAGCFASLRASAIADRLPFDDGTYSDAFNSSLPLPGVSHLKIWQDSDGTCELRGEVHRGRSLDGAREAYEAMKAHLVEGLSSAGHERITRSDHLPTCDVPIANGWKATVWIHRQAQSDTYIVNLEMEHVD